MPFIGYELGTSTLDLSEEILSASGNSSETLSRSIGSDIEVLVYVADNLLHTDQYSITGSLRNEITFTGGYTPNVGEEIIVRYLGKSIGATVIGVANFHGRSGQVTLISQDLANKVNTAAIQDDAVTSAKITSSSTNDGLRAISGEHIKANSVGTSKLVNESVTHAKLATSLLNDADRAVDSLNIKSNAVDTRTIAGNAVTPEKLGLSLSSNAGLGQGDLYFNTAVNRFSTNVNGVNWHQLVDTSGGQTIQGSLEVSTLLVNGSTIISSTGSGATLATDSVTTDAIVDLAVTSDKLSHSGTTDGDRAVTTDHVRDAAVTTDKLASNSVTTAKITDAHVTTAKIADLNVTTAKIAADAVDSTKLKDSASVDADRAVTTDHIRNLAINTSKITDSAVTAAKIGSNAVTESKISDLNVTTAKLADNAVTTAKINDAAVDTDQIANNAITYVKIATGNVTTAKIANDAVTTDKIDDAAVTSAKIATNAVTSTELAESGTVDADRAVDTNHIKDNAVTNDKLANASVDTDQLVALSVTTGKIVNGNVTSEKLANQAVTTAKLNADAVTGAKIADDSIDSEHYVDGSIDTAHIAGSAVTEGKIADANVTTAKIADANVTTAKIADANVTTGKLAADAVTGAKIADDSIDSEHYVDGSIDTAHIGDSQVTTAKIAADAIDGTKIADDSIDSEHYVDGSIDTAHIADDAVTAAKIADQTITATQIAGNAVNPKKLLLGLTNSSHSMVANLTDAGDIYFDESTDRMNVYDGAAWRQFLDTHGNQTITNDLTISGDLTVTGTTTYSNTTNLSTNAAFITLNQDVTGTPSEDAYLEVERGTSTNVKIQWNETNDRWEFTNDGSTYYNLPVQVGDLSNNVNYIDLADISVTQNAAGTAGLSYNNANGVFTYTPPDLSSFATTTALNTAVANSSNWDTAYGWGDHSAAGYLTSETSHADVVVDGDFTTSGLMTTDGSGTYTVTTNNSTNWNTAYSWGDHSTAGYLTSYTETQTLDNVLALGATTTRDITTTGKILFSNLYATTGDLPSASTYHGMFAHVHGTGKGYFAHAGNWVELVDTASSIDKLSDVDTSTVAPTDGQALVWDNTAGKWEPGTVAASSSGITVKQVQGSGGTVDVTATSITELQFDKNTGFNVTDLGSGVAFVDFGSAFKTWYVSGQTTLVASGEDEIELIAGTGITLTTTTTHTGSATKAITIASSGGGGSISDGDKGDITVSNSGATWSIDSGVVGSNELDNTGVTAATYGNATNVPQLTVDANGRITGVTNVAVTAPTASDVVVDGDFTSGGLMTTDGSGGYSVTTNNAANWNTAYGWGDHSTAGYLTSYTVVASDLNGISIDALSDVDTTTTTPSTGDVLKWDGSKWAPGTDNTGSGGGGGTETDPVFSASEAATITSTNTSNWNTAYSWGDHASAGYLTSIPNATTSVYGAVKVDGTSIQINGSGQIFATGVTGGQAGISDSTAIAYAIALS